MPLLPYIVYFLRLIGLAGWADAWLASRAVKRRDQAVANAPTTRDELEKTLRDGDL
jgi:hypothetical protein